MTPLNIKVVEGSHEMFGYMREPQLKTLQDNSLEADFGMIHNFKVTSPALHRGDGKKNLLPVKSSLLSDFTGSRFFLGVGSVFAF